MSGAGLPNMNKVVGGLESKPKPGVRQFMLLAAMGALNHSPKNEDVGIDDVKETHPSGKPQDPGL